MLARSTASDNGTVRRRTPTTHYYPKRRTDFDSSTPDPLRPCDSRSTDILSRSSKQTGRASCRTKSELSSSMLLSDTRSCSRRVHQERIGSERQSSRIPSLFVPRLFLVRRWTDTSFDSTRSQDSTEIRSRSCGTESGTRRCRIRRSRRWILAVESLGCSTWRLRL